MAKNLCNPIFWVELRNFQKSHDFINLKVFCVLMHAATKFTYQQDINNNMGTDMNPSFIFRGGFFFFEELFHLCHPLHLCVSITFLIPTIIFTFMIPSFFGKIIKFQRMFWKVHCVRKGCISTTLQREEIIIYSECVSILLCFQL